MFVAVPLFVRAYRPTLPPNEEINAQGYVVEVGAEPACWNASPSMAPENSSARPGPKNRVGRQKRPVDGDDAARHRRRSSGVPGRARPAGGQGRAAELAPHGRREHDLAVASLGEIGAASERPRAEVGRGRVDQRRERRRERRTACLRAPSWSSPRRRSRSRGSSTSWPPRGPSASRCGSSSCPATWPRASSEPGFVP